MNGTASLNITFILAPEMSKQNLKYHYPMILRHASKAEDTLDVYFFRDYRNIDSSAYLEILKQIKMMQGNLKCVMWRETTRQELI